MSRARPAPESLGVAVARAGSERAYGAAGAPTCGSLRHDEKAGAALDITELPGAFDGMLSFS
jgi:hypothetical protein